MRDATPSAVEYRFLDWHYQPQRRRLVGPAGEHRLKPLLDRLLRRLLDEPGNMLTRERLLDEVWTRRHVNDEVLSRAVAELRAVLGDDARAPRCVETLPKGGYRWIAPVQRVEAAGAAPATMAASPPRSRRRLALAGIAALAAIALAAWLLRAPQRDDSRAALATGLLDARPLSADARLHYDARFDPSGRVAFIRSERDSLASELVLADPAGLAERVLWQDEHPLRQPTPSPDGREIALLRFVGSTCELWSVAVIDLRRVRLGDCAPDVAGGLEWADAGATLLYSGPAIDAAHAPGLMRLDRASGARRTLTTSTPTEGAHVDPRISSDGTRLVYASRHDGEEQLWQTCWPRLCERRALLARREPVYGHAFEPRGAALWLAGDLISYRALHRLREGGEPELLGGRGARSIDLAANGAAVWTEARYDADIWLRAGDDAAWNAIAVSSRYESQPEFSADGLRLALVSNRTGSESIVVYDRRDGGVRALPLDPALRWVRPTWSAREDALILTAYENRHTRLYRYRLDGDVATPLPQVEIDAFHGTELGDRLVYLGGHDSGRGVLMQWRTGQPAPEPLGLGVIAGYRASERWLVWRTPDEKTLHAAAWSALQPVRTIAADIDADAAGEAFALAGDTLVYVDAGTLWHMNLSDGSARKAAGERVPSGHGPSLAVSADGALAVVTLTSIDMDLMIADAPAGAVPRR